MLRFKTHRLRVLKRSVRDIQRHTLPVGDVVECHSINKSQHVPPVVILPPRLDLMNGHRKRREEKLLELAE